MTDKELLIKSKKYFKEPYIKSSIKNVQCTFITISILNK